VTEAGIRFHGFETACVGPLERDLAHAADEAARACPGRPGRAQACAGGW
jgi:hypothetical protein